ncbi:hypothetical protein CMV_019547 [Castanea mollissima]|uniref:Transmembrane protein n=1 Tax=Castanea mollissima TaxID=60419 RepID=A0A8J4R052_9ROSI|nr:hypothetical protein CMV_019547 [Castanea mollissima]
MAPVRTTGTIVATAVAISISMAVLSYFCLSEVTGCEKWWLEEIRLQMLGRLGGGVPDCPQPSVPYPGC